MTASRSAPAPEVSQRTSHFGSVQAVNICLAGALMRRTRTSETRTTRGGRSSHALQRHAVQGAAARLGQEQSSDHERDQQDAGGDRRPA